MSPKDVRFPLTALVPFSDVYHTHEGWISEALGSIANGLLLLGTAVGCDGGLSAEVVENSAHIIMKRVEALQTAVESIRQPVRRWVAPVEEGAAE